MNCLSYCNTIFQRVDDLPSLVDATRNHAYITPDNKIYIINADGSGYMQMSTEGGGVTVGLSSNDGSITIVETKDSVTHTFDLKVSDDIINRIIALEGKQDKDTIYDDSELEAKINDILNRIANLGGTYTAGTGITISDDGVISLVDPTDNDTTYTAGDGISISDEGVISLTNPIGGTPSGGGETLYNVSTGSFGQEFSGFTSFIVDIQDRTTEVFGQLMLNYNNKTYTVPLAMTNGTIVDGDSTFVVTYNGNGYTVEVSTRTSISGNARVYSVLYRETPDALNTNNTYIPLIRE